MDEEWRQELPGFSVVALGSYRSWWRSVPPQRRNSLGWRKAPEESETCSRGLVIQAGPPKPEYGWASHEEWLTRALKGHVRKARRPNVCLGLSLWLQQLTCCMQESMRSSIGV